MTLDTDTVGQSALRSLADRVATQQQQGSVDTSMNAVREPSADAQPVTTTEALAMMLYDMQNGIDEFTQMYRTHRTLAWLLRKQEKAFAGATSGMVMIAIYLGLPFLIQSISNGAHTLTIGFGVIAALVVVVGEVISVTIAWKKMQRALWDQQQHNISATYRSKRTAFRGSSLHAHAHVHVGGPRCVLCAKRVWFVGLRGIDVPFDLADTIATYAFPRTTLDTFPRRWMHLSCVADRTGDYYLRVAKQMQGRVDEIERVHQYHVALDDELANVLSDDDDQ